MKTKPKMKNLNAFLLGSVSAFLSVGIGLNAMAQQAPGSPGAPPVRQDDRDTRSPSAQAAVNFDPRGVRVGSFMLLPEIELDEVYNDNIFATPIGATGQTASFVQLIKPTLRLKSDWNQHALNFFARGSIGLFAATSIPNYTDYSVGTDGRYDIGRDWNGYGGGSFSHSHEDPGTPNGATGAVPPNLYDQIAGNVGYFQKFNRLSVRADGRIDNYHYTNNFVSVNGSLPSFARDRTEFRESLRTGYEFMEGTQAWVRGSLNQRNYINTPDATGFFRNSSGFDVVAGLQIDFGGITSLEVFGGYLEQNFVDPNFKKVSQPTFGLTGYWNPIREVSVRPFVQRSVNDSGLTNAPAGLTTSGGIDIDYMIRPDVKLSAHGDYALIDYSLVSQVSTQVDQYITLRAAAIYTPDNIFFLGPSYQYVTKTSNQTGLNYNQNLIMLRLGAHL